jgi:murein L,D-transpeptidase YcbB/YkuD
VLVNLADFTLKFVDGPKTVFDTRVIVGTPYQKSPLFSAAITAVELNPYWHVPDKIARTELLPLIRDDPYYLADNNLRVLATERGRTVAVDPEMVDWSALRPDAFPFRLRQEPGLENALGRIKFLMPNRWDVYLHDTPSRELFERAVRSFSHGCIRVENPFELAGRLFAPEGAWTPERLAEAAANGERRTIRLAAPVPAHIVYLTAWTNRDGSVHFRDDIYGRDQRLGVALARTAAR